MSERAGPFELPYDELLDHRGFWERYSANGELPWSSAISLALLAFLVMLPIVLVTPFSQRDPTQTAVDVLFVGEDENAPVGKEEGLEADAALGTVEAESAEEVPSQILVDELEKVPESELPPPDVKPVDQGKEVVEETGVARSALDRLAEARAQLEANLNKGQSEGTGGGGRGTGGRGARVARWVLHFSTRSSQDYLAQLDGLGAEIAFPEVGNRWRYFFDASSPSRRSEIRDLTSENRLYWVDERLESIAGVAQELDIPVPPFMIVFLPLALEERMLQMELAHQNLREEEIERTDFEVITRGQDYDVRVRRQIPR